jgi:hypothetical protein
MFPTFSSPFSSLPGLNFLTGPPADVTSIPIHHLVSGHPPQSLPYSPEVKIVASPEGFDEKCPAGGAKIAAGLGASKARIEKGIKIRRATGVSAGALQAVIDTNTHVDPKVAAQAVYELLQMGQKDLNMLAKSYVPCDPLRLLLSGYTSLSPEACFQQLIDKLGLKWNSRIRILACAVEIDPNKPWSLSPWTLTNYRHWPVVIDETSGIPLARALWMSGAVPGLFVSPELGKSDRGYTVIGVDGAFINRIPHIPGDVPSIGMSYTRATKMPHEWTNLPKEWNELQQEWLALFQPTNWFDPASWQRATQYCNKVTQYWTKVAQYANPVKQAGLMQQFVEIYFQICGNNNVQMPGDFPIVLGLDDFAALNLGASEEEFWGMFEHGYEVGLHRYTDGLASGQLVIPH